MDSTSQNEQPIYSTFGDDPDLADLVEMFVGDMPDRIARLEAQLAAADWEGISQTAHQLKGAAGSYGFDQLTAWAARAESTAKSEAGEEDIRRAVLELIGMCKRLRPGTPGD